MCLPLANLDSRTLAKGEHCGFAWQIVPNSIGHRCGYIRVEPGHPWFGKSYDEIDVEVHGGLTFGEPGTACPTHDEKAEYWYGFDCAHGGDAPDPSLVFDERGRNYIKIIEECESEFPFPPELRRHGFETTIKDTAYVERECRSLCEQAAAAMAAAA